LIVSHRQNRASSGVRPAGSSAATDATRRGARRLAAGVDAGLEATSLLALSAGLGTSVLADQRSADEALAVIRYHLDRLLPTGYRP
jgi:hypothetical protein